MVPLDRWIEAKYFFCVNEIEGGSRNWSEAQPNANTAGLGPITRPI
jgi:hypothetical protein